MTDDVMRRTEVEIAPERDEFEIVVVPEEPEDVVITAEENTRRMEQAAREQALAYWQQTCTGTHVFPPDLTSWPERYRKAFSDELERLRREHR